MTIVQDGDNIKFATAEEIEVTITQTTADWVESDAYALTVPELEADHYLYIRATTS